MTIIDPPGGWRYGFPKPIPEERKKDSTVWLVEQGYPQELINEYGEFFYCRYWEEPDQDSVVHDKAQTAVEWLFEKLWDEPKDKFTWYALRSQAKKMEREISDEEIEKQSWIYEPRNKFDAAFIREAFIRGAEWYREQLKNKQ